MSSSSDPSPLSAPPAEKKRRRPALACEQCRRRKVRCDRNSPCGTCVKAKSSACTFALNPLPSSRHSVPVHTKHHSSVGSALMPLLSVDPSSRPSSHANEFSTETARGYAGSSSFAGDAVSGKSSVAAASPATLTSSSTVESLVERVKQLEQELSAALGQQQAGNNIHYHASSVCASECDRDTSVLPIRGTVSKNRFYGGSHWMNGTECVSVESIRSCAS
jgi:hypothetical protein